MNELKIYGDIGWDVRAKDVDDQLAGFGGEPVRVRINSGGGDVYEGIAILNSLRAYTGEITTVIDSLAASAASFIAVGAVGRVIIRPNAEMMIHKAWAFISGNADEIDKAKADLARQDLKIAQIYADRAGGELDDWLDRMASETWYSADEALEAGLVDAVEDAKVPVAYMAGTRRVMDRFKFANRAAAPPPHVARSESGDKTTKPSDGQIGDKMTILNQLAQELGKRPEDVKKALSGFFNETVTISGEVDVTYPEGVKVAPTEKVTVRPLIDGEEGEVPAGVTFEVTAADGFTAEVDEAGVVTITAPSGVEPGDTAEFTVLVNDTSVPLSVTVRALSEETTEEGAEDDTLADPDGGAAPGDVVTVPRAVWNEYMEDRARYSAKLAEDKQRALEAKVDTHIREGRYSAAHRSAAIAAYKTDPVAADKIWGALPKNVAVPMEEIGHSGDVAGMTKVEKLRAKAAANRESKKEK